MPGRSPTTYAAQLATLVKEPPEGDRWLHELKYDGYRIGCRIDGGKARLLSRNGNDWTDRFPPVREAAERLRVKNALLDGEVAIVLDDGRTSFQALQKSFGRTSEGRLAYFLFDLLYLDGEDWSRRPLEERKERLRALLGRTKGVLRYSDHVVGRGAELLQQACRSGAEGIVSKRRDLPYRPGRGPGWLKTKCTARQEVVIGGFTDPEGAREGIGALLIGVHDAAGRLVFSGKVGTGFTQASARDLRRRLEAIEQAQPPFADPPRGALGRTAHWVRPKLVAEVAFTEWTGDGKIRHPSFQGLREDKPPAAITRETAVEAAPAKPAPRPAPSRGRRVAEAAEVAGVRLSHPDRVVYPDVGLTKLDVARYFESIAEAMLPHVRDRALTLVRCPEGIGSSCFFMKHWRAWGPAALRRVKIREKKKVGEYLVADSAEALVSLVQMNVLEVHTWNSTMADVERPDRVVFDLDPGPDVSWADVVAAARLVRSMLDELDLRSFVKTTGGRGAHVVVPLTPRASWDECLEFSRLLAESIERLDPKRYTKAFAKAGRERKILIDYMRNNRTNTSVAAFSTRARPGAPVSLPIDWEELTARATPEHHTVRSVPKRLARQRADPWRDYWRLRQQLGRDVLQRVAAVR